MTSNGSGTTTAVERQPIGEEIRAVWLTDVSEHHKASIGRLLNRVFELDHNVGYPGPVDPDKMDEIVDELAREVQSGARRLLALVTSADEIIGQLVFTQNPYPNCRHVAELSRFVVDPDYRGRGMLRRVTLALQHEARERGVEVVHCAVRAGTRAARLWLDLGFVIYGRFPDYARDNAGSHDCLFMYRAAENPRTKP